jgi:hypothetical protein
MGAKKYIFTAAQACYYENEDGDQLPSGVNKSKRWTPKAVPHYHFLKGLETYCKENGAELVIQPVAGKNSREDVLHEDLMDREDIFWGERMILNQNLQCRDIVVPPQNVDPAEGKATLVSDYNSSLIFAHTKQRFCPVPVFNADLPRYLYTPGAVTLPNYASANHRGDTARRKHVFGALLVEILDETYYNITNIRALRNGKFSDRGTVYDGDLPQKDIAVDFMTIGDLHLGNHDEKALQATYEMLAQFKPNKIFLHDFFDGYSINHHEKDNPLRRIREFQKGRLILEEELRLDYKELMKLLNETGSKTEIYLVSSNHHAFLPKYINDKSWIDKDLWNADFASYLFHKGISLNLPENEIDDASYLLEEGLRRFGPIPERVKFLRLKDNLRRYGYQLACHGDKGSWGARGGNAKSMETVGGGKSVIGHRHSMEIYGNTYIIGTNSLLDQFYAAGYGSASIAANAIGHRDGTIQMLPIIDGRWMKPKEKK